MINPTLGMTYQVWLQETDKLWTWEGQLWICHSCLIYRLPASYLAGAQSERMSCSRVQTSGFMTHWVTLSTFNWDIRNVSDRKQNALHKCKTLLFYLLTAFHDKRECVWHQLFHSYHIPCQNRQIRGFYRRQQLPGFNPVQHRRNKKVLSLCLFLLLTYFFVSCHNTAKPRLIKATQNPCSVHGEQWKSICFNS